MWPAGVRSAAAQATIGREVINSATNRHARPHFRSTGARAIVVRASIRILNHFK
jgi:hypothetical protein